jgi:hypothetical protein
MGCDYYTQSELVIEYVDDKGAISKTRTNRVLEKGYVFSVPDEDSDDDEETQLQKYNKYIEKMINEHTYKKMLYDNEEWVKSSYEKKYVKDLKMICPRMVKLVKMYKDYTAWKRF